MPFPISSHVQSFSSGAFAGALATTITYPLDLLRTRFAAQGPQRVYHSFVYSLNHIYSTEGLPGFFRGLPTSIVQIVPYVGLFFSMYELLRPSIAHLDLPFGIGDAAAGVIASVSAKTGVFPLDLIKKRLQVQGPTREKFAGGAVPSYGIGGWGKVGREIVRQEGWTGLYRGLAVGLVKAAPASAITMWTYERAMKELQKWKIGE